MEIRYANYYKKFQCIAGACPDTCCAGWEIPVDRASEKRYKDAQKTLKYRTFAKKLKKHIKHGHIISENVTCPFLNTEGLCDIYIELGPEALCHTCTRYPRHMEDYGDLHEIVLLLSCPEVARLVLEENDGTFSVRNLPDRTGNMDGIDSERLNILLCMRDLVWKIGMDSSLTIDRRMAFALALGHDVQRRMMCGNYKRIEDVFARYGKCGADERFFSGWKGEYERFLLMSDFMETLAGLETICRDWPEMLETCRSRFYHSENSREQYSRIREKFLNENPKWSDDWARIFHYFIYSFMLSALYDGDVLTKIKMAVLCTMAIEDLYMAAGMPDMAEKVRICHALARQIENSDENRSALELFLKQETFSARRIIDALV